MVQGMFYRYGIYSLIVLGYYTATVFFLRLKLGTYWQCLLAAVPVLLLVNPHGYFSFI